MTNTAGLRRGTRYMFSRQFRKHGTIALSRYMQVYKRGQYVDIKADGAIQKGMPHKSYHGRTGKVFNVTRHACGVLVNKRVNGRIIAKKINVRVDHIRHSKCQQDLVLQREKRKELLKWAGKNPQKKKMALERCKRKAEQPRAGHYVATRNNAPQLITPIPYEFIA